MRHRKKRPFHDEHPAEFKSGMDAELSVLQAKVFDLEQINCHCEHVDELAEDMNVIRDHLRAVTRNVENITKSTTPMASASTAPGVQKSQEDDAWKKYRDNAGRPTDQTAQPEAVHG